MYPRPRTAVGKHYGSRRVPSPAKLSVATSGRLSTRGSTVGQDGGLYVVAALQNKGSGVEVGVAALNLDTGKMTLTQLPDSASYTKTRHFLSLHPPDTVLVAESGSHGNKVRSQMIDKIEDEFQLQCKVLPRVHWNADNGLDKLKQLCVEGSLKTLLTMVSDRHYALCAASALLSYTNSQGIAFGRSSVRINYETMKGYMFIDTETAKNLELVQNNLTKKMENSLLWTLKGCVTPMGLRLLRSSILQPSNHEAIIENRLDVVEEFISAGDKLGGVRKKLKLIEKVDFDKLITNFSQNKRTGISAQQTESRISILLQLRNVATTLPELGGFLKDNTSHLLDVTHRVLSHPSIGQIADMINERINDEASLGGDKGPKRFLVKRERLYAVRSNYNHLLDLARATHQENVTDIMELAQQTKDDNGIQVSLEWNEDGYRFVCPREELDEHGLPPTFINIERGRAKIKFTSPELQKRNARMLQTQNEVFLMSEDIVDDLWNQVSRNIECLYACSEAIALVDVLAGFAFISGSRSCVRPQFSRTIAIKNGRHPILETTLPAGDYVSNDVYATDGPANFQIIQGPNMSGKSTYLRQVGLLAVQAMVGCFVPAEYGSFKLHDTLLTRLSNDDNMEKSLSTFAAEMATSAMILNSVTHKSLVLIDELGRGTAPIEGVGLAHAIAEKLIQKRCFTFFATHFQELSQTLYTNPGVVTLHVQVQHNSHMADSHNLSSTFHYKVAEGAVKADHYGEAARAQDGSSETYCTMGLELAKIASLPNDVMAKAWEVSKRLSDLEEQGRNASYANAIAMRRKSIMELRGKLQQVVDASKTGDPGVIDYLRKLRNDLLSTLQTALRLERENGRFEASAVDASDVADVASSTQTALGEEAAFGVPLRPVMENPLEGSVCGRDVEEVLNL